MLLGLVDFMQLITLIPLMGFNLPSHTRMVFKILAFANMELGIFQKIYTSIYGLENLDESSTSFNNNYNDYDIFKIIFFLNLITLNSFTL